MITGTFLDEIGHDLPSSNWGPEEWTRDFAAMKADGIDTVVLARGGFRDRAAFDSPVLRKRHPHLIVETDLAGLFLSLAERNDMDLWFGTYDPGDESRNTQKDIDLERAFADEVWERYGRSSAFRGWYLSQPIDAFDEASMRQCEGVSAHLRQMSALPVLISPRSHLGSGGIGVGGGLGGGAPITMNEHERRWSAGVAHLKGCIDVIAFHDGGVPFAQLSEFLAVNAKLARAQGIETWSNVESLDSELPARTLPIAWPKLRFKMEAALAAGVDKLMTFEYAHFLSPNSMFNSAHTLHKRYREWLATQK
jgi:hypothetical protein